MTNPAPAADAHSVHQLVSLKELTGSSSDERRARLKLIHNDLRTTNSTAALRKRMRMANREEAGQPARRGRAPDEGQRLGPQAAKYLRELIMSGSMRGGTRLHVERLAVEIGISATPVREALMSLAGEGLVSFEAGKGFRAVAISRQDVLDLYDMQAFVSGELAARAAATLTPEDHHRLDEWQTELVDAVARGDAEAVQTLDFSIHRLINRAANSPRLVWMLSLTLRYVPFNFYGDIAGWQLAARDDHALIFRGLREHSPRAAAEAMRAHIRTAGLMIADRLAEQGVISEQ